MMTYQILHSHFQELSGHNARDSCFQALNNGQHRDLTPERRESRDECRIHSGCLTGDSVASVYVGEQNSALCAWIES